MLCILFLMSLFTSSMWTPHSENGKRVVGNNGGCKYSLVTSYTGFEKGKHVWQIRGNMVHCGSEAGIVTVYNCTNNGTTNRFMNSKEVGKSYYYHGRNGGILRKGEGGSSTNLVSNCGAWEKGKTVTIFLDCQEAKVTFWRDQKKLGTLEIEKGVKYYPAMCECCCKGGSDYVLITSL